MTYNCGSPPQVPAYTFDYTDFVAMYPAFTTSPSQTFLSALFTQAGLYIANSNYGPLAWAGATLPALYLMTAHLAQLSTQIAAGQSSGITVSATIDKISTAIQQFQYPNQWQLWLGSTEYGKQLLALLQVQSVGGFSVPGSMGRRGFGFR